jgi:hypothetical protein
MPNAGFVIKGEMLNKGTEVGGRSRRRKFEGDQVFLFTVSRRRIQTLKRNTCAPRKAKMRCR